MKGIQFYEIAAAALPVLLLTLLLEYRRIVEIFELYNWLRLVLLYGFLSTFTTLATIEIACLLQLAYQPSEPYSWATPGVVLTGVIYTFVFLAILGAFDILNPSVKRKLKREILDPIQDGLGKVESMRARQIAALEREAEQLRSRAKDSRDLEYLVGLRRLDAARVEMQSECAGLEKGWLDLETRVKKTMRFWPAWVYDLRERWRKAP